MGAVAIDPFLSLDVHLIRADEALYGAKDAGRACMVVWAEDSPYLRLHAEHAEPADQKGAA